MAREREAAALEVVMAVEATEVADMAGVAMVAAERAEEQGAVEAQVGVEMGWAAAVEGWVMVEALEVRRSAR